MVFDIYDLGNLGGKSLKTLCKRSKIKTDFIEKYFNNFFDVDVQSFTFNANYKVPAQVLINDQICLSSTFIFFA